jgi:hypothetical protein
MVTKSPCRAFGEKASSAAGRAHRCFASRVTGETILRLPARAARPNRRPHASAAWAPLSHRDDGYVTQLPR